MLYSNSVTDRRWKLYWHHTQNPTYTNIYGFGHYSHCALITRDLSSHKNFIFSSSGFSISEEKMILWSPMLCNGYLHIQLNGWSQWLLDHHRSCWHDANFVTTGSSQWCQSWHHGDCQVSVELNGPSSWLLDHHRSRKPKGNHDANFITTDSTCQWCQSWHHDDCQVSVEGSKITHHFQWPSTQQDFSISVQSESV